MPLQSHQSDEDILAASQDNPDSFAEIVDRYEEAFIRKAQAILRNEEDASDAVQEAFVRIYAAGGKFRKQEGATFKSWAYKILINKCFSVYKKQKRDRSRSAELSDDMLEVFPDASELETYERKITKEYVLSLISRLPVMLARVTKMHYIDDTPQEKIAEIEGISNGAVRARIHRAKKELKKFNLEML